MTNDQIIHEARGLCWHDFYRPDVRLKCKKCGQYSAPAFAKEENPDYSKWEHYGPMIGWAQEKEWWEDFVLFVRMQQSREIVESILFTLLNPLRGRDAIAEFLQERK